MEHGEHEQRHERHETYARQKRSHPYLTPVRQRQTIGNLLSLLLIVVVIFCIAFYLFVAGATGNFAWPLQGWPLGG